MASNIRKDIVNTLYEILINKSLSDIVYDIDINDDKDKALLKKEIAGVLEHKLLLEYVIDKYSKVKCKKLDRYIYIVLLLGAYELLYLTKIPAFATIDTYVELVKKSKYSRLSGYVNAILRTIDRDETIEKINDSDIPEDIKYSIPKDIYEYYKRYDIDVKDAIEKHIYIRVNSIEKDIKDIKDKVKKELDDKNIRYKKYAGSLDIKYFDVYEVYDVKDVLESDAYREGFVYIEDIASIYMIEMLYDKCDMKDIDIDYHILDTCSAPGGKIYGLIHLLKDKKVNARAMDISKDKIDLLKDNKDREKIDDIDICINDATKLNDKYIDKYDLVLCDVPCSGLGVISKKPDIRYNFDSKKLGSLKDIQKMILDVSKRYVKSGGYLSYSTCTITDDENGDNVKYFLDNNKDFALIYEKKLYQNKNDRSDGFYVAILKKI